MARIGDTVNAALGRTDYTPFLQGAQQGAAIDARRLDAAMSQFQDAMEDIGEAKKKKASYLTFLKGVEKIVENDKSKLFIQDQIAKVESAPLMQAAAIGQGATQFVESMFQRDDQKFDQSMRKQAHGLDVSRFLHDRNVDLDTKDFREEQARRSFRTEEAREAQRVKEAGRELDIRQQNADTQSLMGEAALMDSITPPLPDYKGVDDLRKEVSSLPEMKDFKEVDAAYKKVQAASPNAAGDMALIFNYMKILDPGSTVREGEFASAENATGVPGRVRNLWNRLLEGERLNPEQREDFKGEARKTALAQYKTVEPVVKRYSRLAMERGLNPDDVVDPYFLEFPEVDPPTAGDQQLDDIETTLDLLNQGMLLPPKP